MELTSQRRSTSVRQLELLIQFMEDHKDLAMGRVRSKEARALAVRLWEQCADSLNSAGASRTPKEWMKFWNDYKCRVRAKLMEIRRGISGTGGGPSLVPQLSPLEDRVASLIGKDVGPLSGVRIDPIIDTEIHYEETNWQVEDIGVLTENSPALDLSTILPLNSPTITLESITAPVQVTEIQNHEAPASSSNALPQSVQRNRQRRSLRPRPRCPRNESNATALDEARASIARIEELRAQTERSMATANLLQAEAAVKQAEAAVKQAEAAVKQADAVTSLAQTMHTLLESVQAYIGGLRSNN